MNNPSVLSNGKRRYVIVSYFMFYYTLHRESQSNETEIENIMGENYWTKVLMLNHFVIVGVYTNYTNG